MKQPTTRILYNYWNDVRSGRFAPTRFEIEPSRISSILSETFILERTGAGELVFRLAGTRICDQIGRELRALSFSALFGDDARLISGAMRSVTAEGGVLLFEIEGESVSGRTVQFEGLALPLVHPATDVTRYLGCLSAIDAPAWLGTEPVAATTLTAHTLIWPEGRPFKTLARFDRQLPFAPELAAARIVRSDRRQFRILDGGRKE
jgi:hypothetical protein